MSAKMKKQLKYLAACVLRVVTKVFHFFPVKQNRILFHAYDGKHVCCNPKAVFEGLMARYPGQFEYVWALSSRDELQPYTGEKIKNVKLRSLRFYLLKATAKVCVVNSASFPELPLRKNQFQVYTHHGGGAYKTAGAAIKGAGTKSNIKKLTWDAANTSLFLSSSRYFTDEVIRKQKLFDGEVYPYGMPRNDKLLRHTYAEGKKKVLDYYRLDGSVCMILYAPTYRDASKKQYDPIDIDAVMKAVQSRFDGKWIFLMRAHYLGKCSGIGSNVISATDYPDMQDLLCAADILISDYSSCIWDFSFTYKPCILYTPDLEEYRQERGFVRDISEWHFPYCENNESLVRCIENFDEEAFVAGMKQHHEDLGSCETGEATESVCEYIYKVCFGNQGKEA